MEKALPLKTFLATLFAHLNIDDLLNPILEYPTARRRYQVLVYHKVSPDLHPYFPSISPDQFERQITFLRQHYSIFDLEELVDRSANAEIPKRAVAITFDDGYADNYEFAFPILREHRVPATIFLATAAIDNKHQLWHDRIFDAFRFATNGNGSLVFEQVIREAKTLSTDDRLRLVEKTEDTLAPRIPEGLGARMLSWDQVKEMNAAGIRFGSHSVTHPILSREKRQEVRKELMDSKSDLEYRLGTAVSLFAYPNGQPGDYDIDIKKQLQNSGYKCAMTTILGYNNAAVDPYELRRGQPWQMDINMFRLRFFLQRISARPFLFR